MKLTWKTPGEQTQLILDTVVLWIAGLSYGAAPVLDGYGMDMDMSLGLLVHLFLALAAITCLACEFDILVQMGCFANCCLVVLMTQFWVALLHEDACTSTSCKLWRGQWF